MLDKRWKQHKVCSKPGPEGHAVVDGRMRLDLLLIPKTVQLVLIDSKNKTPHLACFPLHKLLNEI